MSTLKSYDTISGKEGTAFIKIDGKNKEIFRAKSIEANVEIKKGSVKCIGRRMEGSKPTGMKGSGKMTLYYGFPLFAEVIRQYKDEGKALYFDLLLTNDDPASAAGKQTVLLKDCSVDGMLLSKLDGDSDDPLEDDMSFTFEDYEFLSMFKEI